MYVRTHTQIFDTARKAGWVKDQRLDHIGKALNFLLYSTPLPSLFSSYLFLLYLPLLLVSLSSLSLFLLYLFNMNVEYPNEEYKPSPSFDREPRRSCWYRLSYSDGKWKIETNLSSLLSSFLYSNPIILLSSPVYSPYIIAPYPPALPPSLWGLFPNISILYSTYMDIRTN